MDDVRKVAHQVSIAIAFQRELAVLKRRIDAAEQLAGDAAAEPITWSEPEVDDADIVVAAAAGAPVRVRRGGKYVDRETEQEAAARRAAESEAAAAAEAKVDRAVALEETKQTERSSEKKPLEETKATDALPSKETPDPKHAAPASVAPPRRMTLRRLRELLDAAPFPIPDADAAAFAAALAAGEDLESRVASVLAERPHPNPKKCISLAAETTRGPLEVTSARRLRETVAAAHAWSERVRRTLPGKRHRASNRAGMRARRSSWRCARTPPSSPYSPTTFRRWTPRSRRRRRGAKPRGRYWTPTSASAPTRASRSSAPRSCWRRARRSPWRAPR